jgi:hypothetical protein
VFSLESMNKAVHCRGVRLVPYETPLRSSDTFFLAAPLLSFAQVCGPGQVACGGQCSNLATDPKNCGGCGNVCPTGQQCTAGSVSCGPGQVACGGQCSNLAATVTTITTTTTTTTTTTNTNTAPQSPAEGSPQTLALTRRIAGHAARSAAVARAAGTVFAAPVVFHANEPMRELREIPRTSNEPLDAAYLPLVLTMGITADNCRLMSRSIRRSIWYHNAVFFAEMTPSNTGTYFMRNARSCWSTAVDLFM